MKTRLGNIRAHSKDLKRIETNPTKNDGKMKDRSQIIINEIAALGDMQNINVSYNNSNLTHIAPLAERIDQTTKKQRAGWHAG